jgi:hypothetical protein
VFGEGEHVLYVHPKIAHRALDLVLSALVPARLPLKPVTDSLAELGVRHHAVACLPIDRRQGTA